jgi:hypothetical protein
MDGEFHTLPEVDWVGNTHPLKHHHTPFFGRVLDEALSYMMNVGHCRLFQSLETDGPVCEAANVILFRSGWCIPNLQPFQLVAAHPAGSPVRSLVCSPLATFGDPQRSHLFPEP